MKRLLIPAISLLCAQAAHAEQLHAADGTTLMSFDTTNLAAVTATTVTGMQPGETIVAMSRRYRTPLLYAVGSSSHMYVISPLTSVATPFGPAGSFTLSGTSFGMDISPIYANRQFRLVSNAFQNLQLNSLDASVTVDANLHLTTLGEAPFGVVALAFSNDFTSTTSSTAYAISSAGYLLKMNNPASSGGLEPVGSFGLGANLNEKIGFDITPGGFAYAGITTGGQSKIYTINLGTGLATQLAGVVGTGATPCGSLTTPPIAPEWRKSGANNSGSMSDLTHFTPDTLRTHEVEVLNLLAHPSIDGDVTVTMNSNYFRELNLFNDGGVGKYTIAGSGALSSPAISVINGSHDITVALTAAIVGVANPADTLRATNLQPQSSLSKGGAGAFEVNRLRIDTNLGSLTTSITINGGKVRIIPGGGDAGTSRAKTLAINAGSLDLTDSKLILVGGTVGTATAGTYTGLTRLLQTGRNGGAWNGTGIITSLPAALAGQTTLAIAAASDTPYLGTTFGGLAVSAGDVLFCYTLKGDFNLDGAVNFTDLVRLAQNYNATSGITYAHGDSDYDGAINFGDLVSLAQNYNQSAFASPIDSATVDFSADWALAQSLVPEPVTAAMVLAALPAVIGRRRR